jgi:antitoxin CptB
MGDRLLWRCRRGMRELDKLVEGYYLRHYPSADAQLQDAFAEFLEEPDPDLLAWLTWREQPPQRYEPLLAVMRTLGKEISA